MKLIRFANIIVNPLGKILVAVADHDLHPTASIELLLKTDRSFEIYQNELLVGHVEATPDDALVALATCPSVMLVEVGENGPSRIHENVHIRAADE